MINSSIRSRVMTVKFYAAFPKSIKHINYRYTRRISHICTKKCSLVTYNYILIAPDAVPIAAIRNSGSHAKAVGLFGNPCCTV